MAEYLIQDSTLTDIANAIRTKTGVTGVLTPAQMVNEITNINIIKKYTFTDNVHSGVITITLPSEISDYSDFVNKFISANLQITSMAYGTPGNSNINIYTMDAHISESSPYFRGQILTSSEYYQESDTACKIQNGQLIWAVDPEDIMGYKKYTLNLTMDT